MADDCSTSAMPSPVTSRMTGALMNWRSFIWAGYPGWNCPSVGSHTLMWSSAPSCCSGRITSSRRFTPVEPMAKPSCGLPPTCPNTPPPSDAKVGRSVEVLPAPGTLLAPVM